MLFHLLRFLFLSVCLSGCMVGPRYSKPCLPIQPEWTHAPDEAENFTYDDDPEWWLMFGDETLNALIYYAYLQNRSLEISGTRVYQAYANLAISYGQLFPQFQQLQTSHSYNRLSQTTATPPAVPTFQNYFLNFFATWEIDLWGKFRHGVAASYANLQGSVFTYRDVFRSLAGTIGQTYMQIIGFNRKIEFLKENVRIQEKTVRIVHAKKELGEISALDLEQAISVLETTKGTLEQQILQKELAKNFLCTLLGVAPYDIEECYAFPSVLPLAPPHPDVGIPLDIIRSRPDIRAAEQQAIAQAHIAGIATAEMLPAFSLTGFFGWESANSNRLFNGNSRIAGFGQDIAWDIFNYGRLSNNVVAQNALLQEFLVNYQNVVINACREVEDAMVSYIQDEKIVDRFSEAVRATNRTVELSMTQYEYGAVDFLNVLTAQSNLVAQQLALVDAETAHVIDYINIQTSLGKGWEFTVCKDFVSPCRREKIGNIHYFW